MASATDNGHQGKIRPAQIGIRPEDPDVIDNTKTWVLNVCQSAGNRIPNSVPNKELYDGTGTIPLSKR
jgi:hypothetical protein